MVKKQNKRKINKDTLVEIQWMKKRKPKELKKIESEQKVKEIDKEKLNMFKGLWGKWDKRKATKKPETSYIITMFYNNGTSKTFIINTEKYTFLHKGKMYVIIYEEVWKDLNLDNYHFYYNEGCPVPINRELYWQKDDDAEIGKQEAFFSVTPHNLKPIINMEYVKALANSVELNKYLQLNTILNFFNLVLSLACAIMIYMGLFR